VAADVGDGCDNNLFGCDNNPGNLDTNALSHVQTLVYDEQPIMFYEPVTYLKDESLKKFIAEVVEEKLKVATTFESRFFMVFSSSAHAARDTKSVSDRTRHEERGRSSEY